MSFTHWLSNHPGLPPLRAFGRKTPSARAICRPMLETLEGRQLLSASAIGYLGGGNSAVLATVTDTTVILTTPVPGSPVFPSEPIFPGEPVHGAGPAFGMIHAIGSQIIT